MFLIPFPARAAAALLCAGLALGASAQSDQTQELGALTQRWLDGALQQSQAAAALPLRMEVSVGALDPRLRLAPCAQVEPSRTVPSAQFTPV